MWELLNGLWRPQKNVGGDFIIRGMKDQRVSNTIVADGAMLFARNLFRGEAVLPATYYLGLTNSNYTFGSALLADIATGEPSGNGYARQAIARSTSGWTASIVGNFVKATSVDVTFTASAAWNKTWTRMFLCDAASGTVGTVFSLSKALDPQTVLSGEGPTMAYEHWIRP